MRWTLKKQAEADQVEALNETLGIGSTLCNLLIQRGVKNFDEAKNFFRPSLQGLHDPFLMKDMDKAVQRIRAAIDGKENILVYGDYDVDGTTAVALVYEFLRTLTAQVDFYIPDRYREGYGISMEAVEISADSGIDLIIALDCGIKAFDQAKRAKALGIDLIVCDHHKPAKDLPEAFAILNPKRLDCSYPFKELSGCGVGFKLLQGIQSKDPYAHADLMRGLDLVATAIAADIVPVLGENRILAHFGLERLNKTPRLGLEVLLAKDKSHYKISDLVFGVAPKINAAGRIDHGKHAVALLTETRPERAEAMAKEIEAFNQERKLLDRATTLEALEQIERKGEKDRATTVVFQEDWHKGVIGIVASRLIEKYHRPTLVLTKSGNHYVGSARSVKGFDVHQALLHCSEFLLQFGGHKYAAGLTLAQENYEAFKEKFEAVVAKSIQEEQKEAEICIDALLELREVNPKFYRVLSQFGPFGPGNMTPVFQTEVKAKPASSRLVGADQRHLKTKLTDLEGRQAFDAIGFGLAEKEEILEQATFKAAYALEVNEWQGRQTLQLLLRDLQCLSS